MSAQPHLRFIWLSLSMMLIALAGCEDPEPAGSPVPPPLPLPDLSTLAACQDGQDNDLDELIDFPEDPGCMSPSDNNEAEMRPLTPCEDQRDNDNDGLIDFDDPSCVVSEGASEDAPEPEPECSNGVDDDEDGYVDFPADESCLDPSGDDESLEPLEWACDNRRDDDADGLIDYPFDPGCASPRDDDERDDIEASMIAQCNDGIDNDQDGYTDLADAECNTPTDARERQLEDEGTALCSNGLDDDEDGLIDAWEDPGCIGPGGASEVDGESLPACADGLDNDGDGYLDFPEEPGCASLGDQDERDPTTTPACLDGEDNDGDGLIDYPQDTGCDHAADTDERGACINAAAVLELSSGETYRGSSLQGRFERSGTCGGRGAPEVTALYQVRRRLRSVTFSTRGLAGSQEGWETTLYARRRCDAPQLETACAREAIDGIASNELTIDDPPLGPLYLIIDGASGRGGDFELSVVETPIEACQNQLDDDGDGLIDFPFDPGCVSADDRDEQSPDPLPACADQADNDGDSLIDYPDDIGCRAAFDVDELDECGQGVPVYPLTSPPSVEQGNSTREGVSSESVGSCGGLGIEKVIRYDNPSNARLTFTLSRLDGVAEEAFLYARAYSCLSDIEELGCASRVIGGPPLEDQDEDQGEGQDELGPFDPDPQHGTSMTLTIESAPQGPVYLFIDHDLEGFPYRLITQRIPLTPRCSDEIDNDGDGFIDAGDDGCEGPEDESERDPETSPICSDGRDNDLDGWTDYPLDLGCAYRGGASEADPEIPPRCSNGIDDNGDGYTDFPFDIGCAARGDDSEANLPEPPECSNLLDDDEDGFVDFPQDPGCVARGDLDEVDPDRTPQCADGVDNDRNGQADYPFDSGCYARGDVREHPPETLPQCSDGVDNDQDGYIDLPYDPGCAASGDESEIDPVITPECANGVDDDNNGRVDWPDDPGCLMRADPREDAEGPLAPRCHDGVDNDDDGFTDLLDIDCSSRFDTTEDAPAPGEIRWPVELLECADEIDNDGDGLIDWPADPGCAALGASCERGGYRRCAPDIERLDEGVCVDLLRDPLNCGECGHECESSCEEGLCVGEPRPLRARLMYCGSSIRPIQQFLTGPLAGSEMIISAGCDPDDSVQALLVTRTGGSGVLLNRSSIQDYLNRGGQVVTERGVSDQVVSALFNIPVVEGSLFGDCGANIQPHTLSRPQDPLWSLTPHAPPPEGALGCGYDLSVFPGLIRLGGWDAQSVSLGYLEYGQGRVWLVESNWRDLRQEMTEQSLELMAAMIVGGGKPARSPALPECMDLYDNDHDGLIDLFDYDCQSARDVTEWSPISPDERVTPECSDGLDNDADLFVDFPFDPECESAGDLDESTGDLPEGEVLNIGEVISVAECADGLDNDGDGDVDWPEDASCHGRGARSESSLTTLTPCQNGQDDDQDGRVDFPCRPRVSREELAE